MDVTSFFTRLIQPPKGKGKEKAIDDIADFDAAWNGIKVSCWTCSQSLRESDLRLCSSIQTKDSCPSG